MKGAVILAVLAGALVWGLAGCGEEEDSVGGPEEWVAAIHIHEIDDSLEFLPGDTSLTLYAATVTDHDSIAIPGVHVTVMLSNPQLGRIVFRNQQLIDTTDLVGRVEFYYESYGIAGDQSIIGSAGGITVTYPLTIGGELPICSVDITITPPILHATSDPQWEDSVHIVGRIRDCEGAGVPGVLLRLYVNGGRFQPLPPTNQTGRAETYWHLNRIGTFGIWSCRWGSCDTAYVVVYPPGASQ